MTPVVEALNGLAGDWTEPAWAVAWQSTLLVGVFAVVALALRRSSPSLRCWLWRIAAVKLLLMPLWGVSILLPTPPRLAATSDASTPARSDDEPAARPWDRPRSLDQGGTADAPRESEAARFWVTGVDWQAWLLICWGLGVAWQVAAIARQRNHLEKLLRRGALADDPSLLAMVAELAGRIGLRRPPKVVMVDDLGSPFVCGMWRPTLVLPRGLLLALAPVALRSVLLHELAHLKRRDLIWDWMPATARLLYFFHPAAHYIVYRARLERELACDQAAMVLTGQAPAGYAATLVEVVSRSSATATLR